jgi:integrase
LGLEHDDLSSSYINLNFCALKHFYFMNDVRINKEKIGKFLGESKKKHVDRGYNHEEIKKLLHISDIRMKVVITVLASTGMRIGGLTPLKLSQVKKIEDYGIYRFTVYESTNDEYHTYCTPEAANYIDSYFEYRTRCGEQLKDDNYFIREQFDVNDLEQVRKHGRALTTESLTNVLHALVVKIGLRQINDQFTGRERTLIPLAHGFSKFWTTQAVHAKVNPEIRSMLLGWKIGLMSAYYRPTENEMINEYMKAVNDLTINEENRLKKKVTELEQKQSEIDLMKYQHQMEMKGINEQLDRLGAAYSKFSKAFQLNQELHEQDMKKYVPD